MVLMLVKSIEKKPGIDFMFAEMWLDDAMSIDLPT